MATTTLLYDGRVSGSLMATACGTVSGALLAFIPYSNGQRVIILGSNV
jgi:hypothetical protein